jgi:hypothetical protein
MRAETSGMHPSWHALLPSQQAVRVDTTLVGVMMLWKSSVVACLACHRHRHCLTHWIANWALVDDTRSAQNHTF